MSILLGVSDNLMLVRKIFIITLEWALIHQQCKIYSPMRIKLIRFITQLVRLVEMKIMITVGITLSTKITVITKLI